MKLVFFYNFDLFFRVVKLLFVSGGFGSGVIFLPQPSDLQPGAPRTPAHRMMAMAAWWKSSTPFSWAEKMVDRTRACEEGTRYPETKSKQCPWKLRPFEKDARLLLVSGRVTNFRGEGENLNLRFKDVGTINWNTITKLDQFNNFWGVCIDYSLFFVCPIACYCPNLVTSILSENTLNRSAVDVLKSGCFFNGCFWFPVAYSPPEGNI